MLPIRRRILVTLCVGFRRHIAEQWKRKMSDLVSGSSTLSSLFGGIAFRFSRFEIARPSIFCLQASESSVVLVLHPVIAHCLSAPSLPPLTVPLGKLISLHLIQSTPGMRPSCRGGCKACPQPRCRADAIVIRARSTLHLISLISATLRVRCTWSTPLGISTTSAPTSKLGIT